MTSDQVAATDAALAGAAHTAIGNRGVVTAIWTTGAVGLVDITPPLTPPQQQETRAALRTHAPHARLISATRMRAPLAPPTDSTPFMVMIPILQRGRTMLWWPINAVQHLLVVGDVATTAPPLLRALSPITTRAGWRCITLDMDGEGRSLDLPLPGVYAHTPAPATELVLESRFARARGEDVAPLLVLALLPNAAAARDLATLMQGERDGVHIVIWIGDAAPAPDLRDACHHLGVVEYGSADGGLPESYRRADAPPNRLGRVVAWSSHVVAAQHGRPVQTRAPAPRHGGT